MDVRKIAVLRANAVGDYLFAVPALEALRAAWPEAEIVLLGRVWHRDFLNGRPGPVDRVAVVPPCPGVNEDTPAMNAVRAEEFFPAMRREEFDIAIQMHGGGRHSNPFVRHLGARLTVGLKDIDAPPLDRWVPYVYFQPEVMRYLEVVSLVGATPVVLEPRLAVTCADFEESLRAVPDAGKPIVVINPGAGDGRRRWPPAKFAETAKKLAASGLRVVVHGTTWDRPHVEATLSLLGDAAQPACSLSLGGLAGLLARARLLVSNDSGPLHLAGAVGTPSVGIYWCGNLINAGQLTRSLHRPLLSWQLDCPACGRDCIYDNCDHHESLVDAVSVEEVVSAAESLLACARPSARL